MPKKISGVWGVPVTDPQELLILLAIERMAEGQQGTFAPAHDIARLTRLSLSTVKRRLGSLRDGGHLLVVNTRSGNFYSIPGIGA